MAVLLPRRGEDRRTRRRQEDQETQLNRDSSGPLHRHRSRAEPRQGSNHGRCGRARGQAYGLYEMAGPEWRLATGDDGTQTHSVDSRDGEIEWWRVIQYGRSIDRVESLALRYEGDPR